MKKRLLVTRPTRSGARALCLVLLLLAGGTSAQDVHTDYDYEVDFSKYKTFAWVESKGRPDGFSDRRIRQAVEQQLTAKGLRSSAGATPDLYIVYKVGVRQLTSDAVTDFIFNNERFDDHSLAAQVVSLEGKLVVDLTDGARKELVWRGTAVVVVSDDSAKNKVKIERAVSKMFKKFPPPPKAR